MFRIPERERKRILLLIPLLIMLSLLFLWRGKSRFEQSFTRYSDRVLDSLAGERGFPADGSREKTGNSRSFAREDVSVKYKTPGHSGTQQGNRDSLFVFDPNTVTLAQLEKLGFTARQARGIVNYREAGKVFRRPEDFGGCYTVSEEKYRQLLPYIRIVSPETDRERVVLAETREAGEVSSIVPRTEPEGRQRHQVPATGRLELNGADSADLVKVRGIGPLTAGRIVAYRRRLGGFYTSAQLTEVAGMNPQNYESILQQIFVDSDIITKIDINFAAPEQLKGHPYLPSGTLNKILKYRQLKGGWRDTRELIEQKILSEEEAEKLSPYLYFRAQ